MTECTKSGCRNLQTTCLTCGRVVCTATFPSPEWISVDELPPKENELVRIWNGKGKITRGRRFIDKLQESGGHYCYYEEDESDWGVILKWMPLPEPPHE